MSASKSFELALDYLFENRNKYNSLAVFPNYGFTNAYGELISNFKHYLIDKISNLISKNIVFNKPIIGSLCMTFQGSCNENYKTAFYTSLVNDLDTYPDIIKESIIEYCNIFNNDITKINDKTDIRIIKAYFAKLLIPVFYIFTNKYDNSIKNINELNKITKNYNIEIINNKYMDYYSNVINYYDDILNIINKKNNDSFKIISLLETYSREYNIISKNTIIEKPKKIIPDKKPIELSNHSESSEEVKPKKKGKEKIPVAVRKIVWNTYIGKDNVKGKCLCCNGEDITSTNFECGHVKSEKHGGEVSIDNLRPICSSCNKSMGSNDMDEFMTRYKIKKPKNWNGIV
jgi:hypothetical protein